MSSGGGARRCSAAVDPQRVGRPAPLPEDHSSWDAEVVDAGARTGWLHLSNRAVLGLTRADLRAGLEAMTDHAGAALVADPSRVSRWETGRQQPPVEVTLGYERLLGSVGGDTDDLVVRLLQGQDSRVAEATLPVAAAKLAAGQVGARHLGDLADLAAQLVPVLGGRALADLLDLVCQLPREHFDRVVRAQRDGGVRDQLMQIRGSSTLIPDAAHRRLARSLAWRAQWGAEDREPPEPDQMLERLVREALFHVDGRRRELAGRLVAATPYGPVLATHVVALTDDPRELLATRAWELVRVLGHGDAHRSVVTRALDDSAPHRAEALLALGLSDVPLTPSEARAVAAVAAQSPDLRYAATLALALASPDSLPALRGLDAVTDRALDWWHRAGPQVVDPM